MYCFGSHVSCAGGLLMAIERAQEVGCNCVQIFVSTPRAWPSYSKLIPLVKPKKSADSKNQVDDLPDEDTAEFRRQLKSAGLKHAAAHATYLINLASIDAQQFQRSVEALVVEWRRADQLGLDGLVMHPGSAVETTVQIGLDNIVRGVLQAIDRVQPAHCKLLLENTAGQGSCLGWNAEQLGYLLNGIDSSSVAVCWDTCHALAAGYDFRTPQGMASMSDELKEHGVLEQITAIHVNDSVKDVGSRVDRHEHIGHGCIGEAGFRLFLNSPHFKKLPMYLETEKGVDQDGIDWDIRNLEKLRGLVKTKAH